MNRARHPVPMAIQKHYYNPQSKKYEIVDAGIAYQMDLEMTRTLKDYFVGYWQKTKDHNVGTWYASLSKEERKKVNRINALEENDFYPDIVPLY